MMPADLVRGRPEGETPNPRIHGDLLPRERKEWVGVSRFQAKRTSHSRRVQYSHVLETHEVRPRPVRCTAQFRDCWDGWRSSYRNFVVNLVPFWPKIDIEMGAFVCPPPASLSLFPFSTHSLICSLFSCFVLSLPLSLPLSPSSLSLSLSLSISHTGMSFPDVRESECKCGVPPA